MNNLNFMNIMLGTQGWQFMCHFLFRNIHEKFMNTFNKRSWIFMNYLFRKLFYFLAVHKLGCQFMVA